MRTVWKHKLEIPATVLLLSSGKVTLVGLQDGLVHIWKEEATGDDVHRYTQTFYIVGTGQEIPSGHAHMDHVGSVMQGPFVWHVYKGW